MNKINDYISKYPPEVQERLERLRACFRELMPEAEEVMAYGVPAFRSGKAKIIYAAHKGHIGFYPEPETIKAFKDKLKDYGTAEGTVRFPHDKPLPLDLIRDMVEYRLSLFEL